MTETLWFDSGWPPPLSSVNAYAGYLFYLSPGDNRRPDPSAATLQAHLDAGRDLAPIWQQGKVDIAAGGFPMGVDHAQRANADADSKGVPSWAPIVYACDADRTLAQVQDYYLGVLSVAGRPVGAYGGSRLIAGLREQLGIRWFMQAAATSWSDGVSPYAQFWQRDPNVTVPGGVVDQVVPLATYPTWKTGGPSMSKATLYPPADTKASWFANAHPGSIMPLTAPVLVLHTTEGGNAYPAYQGGAVAPTLTAVCDMASQTVSWRQHFPINMSARALVNAAGGVQTNTAGAVQVELAGTCAPGGPGMYWPEAPDWALRAVADFVKWLQAQWGLPLNLPARGFNAYPNIARGNDSQRMSFAEWTDFSGICGHQHVPENNHGDPGLFPIARLLAFVNGTNITTPPPVQEDEMLTDDDKAWLTSFKEDVLTRLFSGFANSGMFGSGDATHQALQLEKDGVRWPVSPPAAAAAGAAPAAFAALVGAPPAEPASYTLDSVLKAAGLVAPPAPCGDTDTQQDA